MNLGAGLTLWLAVPIGVLASAGQARAGALTVALDYQPASGCPDLAEFRAVVTARLGRDPFSDQAAEHVLVLVTPRAQALDGRIEWRDPNGRWAGEQVFPLVTADCVRLTRAMGFALAVQIQLLETQTTAPPAAAPVSQPPPAAPPAPRAAIRAPELARPRRSGPELVLGAGPSVGLGMSSGPVMLAGAFVGLVWRRLWLEVDGQASLPATIRRADGAGFSQQELLLGLAACALSSRLRLCVLANAGEARMAGQDVDRASSAVVPVLEVGTRVAAQQRLGNRAFLDAHVDGVAVLSRWTATLDHVPVWTAPRFAAAVGLDAGVWFP